MHFCQVSSAMSPFSFQHSPCNFTPCFYLQSFSTWILRTSDLFGGWTNPFEKYDRQIGSFPQGSGWKFQKSFEVPPASYVEAMENWCLKFHQSIDDNSAAQRRHPEFSPVAPPDLHHILLRKCRDNGHHLGITKHHFFCGRWKVNSPKLQGHRRDKPPINVERKHPSWYLDEVGTS